MVAGLRTPAEPGGRLGQRSLRRAAWLAGVCCYYRADLLEKLHRKPPRTWKEYEELARLLREEGAKSGEEVAGEIRDGRALGPRLGGACLLARAAAYAKERDNYTTLFDEKTLEPAIAGPPFVRALEELVAATKLDRPAA